MQLKGLIGLRGIAAFVVVITHCQQFFFAYAARDIECYFQPMSYPANKIAVSFVMAFFDGSFAVMLFWVLSGVVLSLKYFQFLSDLNRLQIRRYLLCSAFKRYFRLLIPILLSAIAGYILLHHNLFFTDELSLRYSGEYASWLKALFPTYSNIYALFQSVFFDTFFNYDKEASYNPVLWTMEKEYIGSMVLFAFLWWFGDSKWRCTLCIVFITIFVSLRLSWLAAFFSGIIISDYYIRYKREEEAFLESRVAMICRFFIQNIQHIFVVLVILILLIILIGLPNYKGVMDLILASFFVVFSLLARPFKSFLSSTPLLWLGKISFGLYLSHFLLITSLSSFVYLQVIEDWGYTASAWFVTVMTLIISLPLGWGVYVIGDKQGVRLSLWIVKKFQTTLIISPPYTK